MAKKTFINNKDFLNDIEQILEMTNKTADIKKELQEKGWEVSPHTIRKAKKKVINGEKGECRDNHERDFKLEDYIDVFTLEAKSYKKFYYQRSKKFLYVIKYALSMNLSLSELQRMFQIRGLYISKDSFVRSKKKLYNENIDFSDTNFEFEINENNISEHTKNQKQRHIEKENEDIKDYEEKNNVESGVKDISFITSLENGPDKNKETHNVEKSSNNENYEFDLDGDKKLNTSMLEEIIEKANIDTNIYYVKEYTVNLRNMGAKLKDEEGNEELTKKTLYQVKVRVAQRKYNEEEIVEKFKNTIENKFKEFNDHGYNSLKKQYDYEPANKDTVGVIKFPDMHYGKLADEYLTGENYNLSIARQRFRYCVKAQKSNLEILKNSGKNINQIILNIGGDSINIDNKFGTTAKGTPQSSSGGDYSIMVEYLTEDILWAIENLSDTAPIKVVIGTGNHDEITKIGLENALKLSYKNNPNVDIITRENAEGDNWRSVQIGDLLLIFNHGEKITNNKVYPFLVNIYGTKLTESKLPVLYIEHLHKYDDIKYNAGEDNMGLLIRRSPTICGTDKFHHENGYIGATKGCQMDVFTTDASEQNYFQVNMTKELIKKIEKDVAMGNYIQ